MENLVIKSILTSSWWAALYRLLSADFSVSASTAVPAGMCDLRSVRRNYVAGKLQQGICCHAKRRNRYVCIVSPWWGSRLLRRSDSGWLCVQHVLRRSEKRNPCSDCFSGVTDCRNSVVREETGSEIKNNEKIREDSPCLVEIPLFLGGLKKE